MYEARSAELIQIYESIVIEFFFDLKYTIHKIGTCAPRIDKIVSMVNQEPLVM